MEKEHVTDARIECPHCLPHLTIMLSGVLGMSTPTTDDLVLIMNVTPVYWCWRHLCPDVCSLRSLLATLFPLDYDLPVLRP